MSPDPMVAWEARVASQHKAEIRRRLHDGECEWRPNYLLCHCRKRRRIAAGHTTPPGPLIFRNPLCPRCRKAVSLGDGFCCTTCHVSWDDGNDDGHFNDDYGVLNPPKAGVQ